MASLGSVCRLRGTILEKECGSFRDDVGVMDDPAVAETSGRDEPSARPSADDRLAVAPGHVGVLFVVEDEQRDSAERADPRGNIEVSPEEPECPLEAPLHPLAHGR